MAKLDPDKNNNYINFSEHKLNGTAICFKLIICNEQTNIIFFNKEKLIEYIIHNNIILIRYSFEKNAILIYCKNPKENNLFLTRVERKDFQKAAGFIRDNLDKFKPKYTWRGRLLSDMALHGLSIEKWTAYAYWNSQEKIVSYLDYKFRVDGQVELGIQLTAEHYQNQGLATSLIHLFALMYMSNKLFVGSYEENQSMRKVFQKCSFHPFYFYDDETQTKTNKRRERIDINCPENKRAMTNSVYFYCESLLERFLFNRNILLGVYERESGNSDFL